MELEVWRILPSIDSASAAVAGLLLGSSNLKLKHRDFLNRSCSRRNIHCVARPSASQGGGKDLSAIPSSLQVLRQRHRLKKEIHCPEDGNLRATSSITKAFSSMVYMLKSMHRFSLEMLSFDEDLWSFVQREMYSSFLWLFQQVFSSTPKLMVSVMLLLANFTVHSMDCSIAIPLIFTPPATTIERSAPVSSPTDLNLSPAAEILPRSINLLDERFQESCIGGSKGGGGENFGVLVAGGTDGDDSASLWSDRSTMVRDESGNGRNHQLALVKFLQQVPVPKGIAAESLVAPVSAKLEPDDYECFDRTDLLYQHALGADRTNPLILANYAQFLYVVRHDHDRAEKLFRLAMEADPSDGESLSRFASFLWLARGDTEGAEDAYKSAMASDPGNPFHFGSYAHFLWHTES